METSAKIKVSLNRKIIWKFEVAGRPEIVGLYSNGSNNGRNGPFFQIRGDKIYQYHALHFIRRRCHMAETWTSFKTQDS